MPSLKLDIPPRRSLAFFAAIAMLMVIVSYLVVLLLATACVYVPYLIISNTRSPGLQSLALFLFGIVIAAAMVWSLIPRRDTFEPPGMLLTRTTQPRLFAELEDIARVLKEPLPREVYLVADVNAFVADRGDLIGFGGRRIMGIGLPLFSILTVSELRAVLAHEFGHYFGGDTALGPWVYKAKLAIIRVFQNIGSVRRLARIHILAAMYVAVTTILKWYFLFFGRVITFVSRRQEYRADELACLIAGSQPLVDGLQSIHRAALAWPVYWKSAVGPLLGEGCLIAISDGFSKFLAAPDVSAHVQKMEAERRERKRNPYDTHPPLRDRIAAAQAVPLAVHQPDSRSASVLLDNLSVLERQFIENLLPKIRRDALQQVSWDEVAIRVTIPAWQKSVDEYAALLKTVSADFLFDQIQNVPSIVLKMRDPQGATLSPIQRKQRVARLFATALALALVRAGWEVQVQPGVLRIRRGAKELNPFLVVEQMLAGKMSREAWMSQCRELGISGLPFPPEAGQAAAAASS